MLYLCVVAAAFASTNDEATVKITGYQPDEYAVTGDVERQLNENVVMALVKSLPGDTDNDITIFITGSADQTGVSKHNVTLANQRAEEARAYLYEKLAERFPKAKIDLSQRTQGDELDAKMVIVKWKISPHQAGVVPDGAKKFPLVVLSIIAIAALIVLVAVVAIMRHRRVVLVSQPGATSKQETEEMIVAKRELTGEIFSVPAVREVVQTGKGDLLVWTVPLPKRLGSDANLYRERLRELVDAVQHRINDPAHDETVAGLVAIGKIKQEKSKGEKANVVR